MIFIKTPEQETLCLRTLFFGKNFHNITLGLNVQRRTERSFELNLGRFLQKIRERKKNGKQEQMSLVDLRYFIFRVTV